MKLLQFIKSLFDDKSNYGDKTDSVESNSEFEHGEINPATGLPMQGMFDTAGNPIGCNQGINPATGLPMQGILDIAGNPLGCNLEINPTGHDN
ncbi:hypothetical protein [Lonepinella sp. MS14437]|uniref:hypothetical protein n=1 Tax=unclassified Lonepinella TaxID=2642006 RepID=UPI0036DE21E9